MNLPARIGSFDPSPGIPQQRSASLDPPVYLNLLPIEALDGLANTKRASVLGVIGFDDFPESGATAPYPVLGLPMSNLDEQKLCEIWLSPRPARYGEHQGIRYACNSDILFGSFYLPEQGQDSVETRTYQAYCRILDLIRRYGYTHLVRVWNYLPRINGEYLGLENYQRFCLGRHQAFAEADYVFDRDLPAASAIGTGTEGLRIYFIASRTPGRQIENPRQVSAYRYPLQYGPRSPSFSRATLTEFGGERQLYLSGTASIVGHETLHPENAAGQLRETLINIQAVLNELGHPRIRLDALGADCMLKVYVRHPEHFGIAKQLLEETLHPSCPVIFLQGDICRRDLLLEIEGVIRLSHS
jgi:chorismate lyase/3-hydroxybenzoate synthase